MDRQTFIKLLFSITMIDKINPLSALTKFTNQLKENDIIVIHDGARPFVTSKEIDEITNSVLEFGASSLSEKVSETLVSSLNNKVS